MKIRGKMDYPQRFIWRPLSGQVWLGQETGRIKSAIFRLQEPVTRAPSHRMLAMLRGEKEGFLKLSIQSSKESNNIAAKALREKIPGRILSSFDPIEDSYERL